MIAKRKLIDRERLAGATIFMSLFVILLSMVGIWVVDVKVSNIKFVDSGLYTIITDKGSVNIGKNDILRIERTYTEAAITGIPVELNKIFTTKGFIYFSSLDPFYETGDHLIDSVDFEGKPVWNRENNSETNGVEKNVNFKAIQSLNYAIGTPSNLTFMVLSVLFIRYAALGIGGLALLILIFPLRMEIPISARPFVQYDPDYSPSEETLGEVAK